MGIRFSVTTLTRRTVLLISCFMLPSMAGTLETFLRIHMESPVNPSSAILTYPYKKYIAELKNFPPEKLFLSLGIKSPKFISRSHPAYKAVLKNLESTYRAYKETFPNLVGDSPIPALVGLWSEKDQFSVTNLLNTKGAQENLVLFQIRGDSVAWKDENELKGTLAHELSHIYLRHSLRDQKVDNFFMSKPNLIGPPAILDAQINQSLRRWVNLAEGNHLSIKELNGLPFSVSKNSVSVSLFLFLLEFLERPEFPECRNLGNAYENSLALIYNKYSRFSDDFLPFSAEELEKINEETRDFVRVVETCSSKTNTRLSIGEIIRRLTGVKPIGVSVDLLRHKLQFQSPETLEFIKNLESYPPAIGFLKTNSEYLEEMRKIEEAVDVRKYQHYSTEVQADEYAAVVLLNMGLSPEDTLGLSLLRKRIGNNEDDIQKFCIDLVVEELNIPFGSLVNQHPTECWRYAKLRRIHQEWRKIESQSERSETPTGVYDKPWLYAEAKHRQPTSACYGKSGKWLIFVPNEKADSAWNLVKSNVEQDL